MALFDVTDFIVERGRPGRMEMVEWLGDNVGEYHGPGDAPVMHIGSGWEILVDYNPGSDYEDTCISFIVDITNDTKATLFALKWIN